MTAAASSCPTTSLRLTVLVENTSPGGDLVAEHGFAALLETGRGTVLFDTGARGKVLRGNAAALGVLLSQVDAIVLSHGHHDHTGGLPAALSAAPQARVYLHRQTLAPRWNRGGSAVGMPDASRAAVAQAACAFVEQPEALPEGVLVSGPVPGPPAPAQEGFLAGTPGETKADEFADEMFALARTPAGWVLVTGCCHRGLENTLALAHELTGGRPVRTVVGGLHLKGQPPSSLASAATALEAAGTTELLVGHCTGAGAMAGIADRSGLRVEALHVGFRRRW